MCIRDSTYTGVKGISPLFSSDESELDEVHHMHERCSISPDHHQSAFETFARGNGCTIIRGPAAAAAVDHQKHHPAPNDMEWEERGSFITSAAPAAAVAVMHRPIPTQSMTTPGPVVGNKQSVFTSEQQPDDLINKSLIRQDPRLLSRSGVYRGRTISSE